MAMALYFFNSRRRPASSLTGGRVSDDGADGGDDALNGDDGADGEGAGAVPRGVGAWVTTCPRRLTATGVPEDVRRGGLSPEGARVGESLSGELSAGRA